LPRTTEEAAEYDALPPYKLERDSNVNDICDFVVEYIHSDVLVCLKLPQNLATPDIYSFQGLLSDRLLIIAGMCKYLDCTKDNPKPYIVSDQSNVNYFFMLRLVVLTLDLVGGYPR